MPAADPLPRPAPGLGWLYLLVLILGLVLLWRTLEGPRPLHDPAAPPRPVTPRGDLAADEQATIALFQAAAPSVVYVRNLDVRRSAWNFDWEVVEQGSGSGFVWDGDGHVVTNQHVIAGGRAFLVTLADGSSWEAAVVGRDRRHDLAVLRIEAPADRLPPILLGSSGDLQVGQKVFAIGNPFGLDHTLTTGVISGLGRSFTGQDRQRIEGAIQTDAAINPGNSGGPLLDSAGRFIGVNTAILSPSGASAGIGFAIPVDTVRRVVTAIIQGRLRAGLGVLLLPAHVARRLGVRRGALVGRVEPGSAAERAGLRGTVLDERGSWILGDVVLALDGEEVAAPADLERLLAAHRPGEEVELLLQRGRRQLRVRVVLEQVD